jgi:hypothetical protein
MTARKLSRDPLAPRLRHFAWSIALVLAVVSSLAPHFHPFGVAAAVIFALGTVLPYSFRWPYFALERSVRAVLPARLTANFPTLNTPHRSTRKSRKERVKSDE